MQIAEQHIFDPGYGFYVHWLSTSPATGSEYQLSSAANYVNRKEFDPLGADVTTPPDPTVIREPVFYSPKFSNMAMEYEWGPSEEYLQANADWAAQMNETWENIRQMHEAEDLWQNGDRSGAKMILNNNPNIGVETADGKSYFGKDASDFLTGVSASGREIEVVDHFGHSEQHFAHAPANPSTKCPPVQFKVTGIAPKQAPDTTAITQTARADIPDGGVAIKPRNFGVKGINGKNRSVFLKMRFSVDWSTATPAGAPTGIPTEGPFLPVDVVGPASVRNSPGNMLDVYNYTSKNDAGASTRTVMVTAFIPVNRAGVKCPK
jgi:hypothetical protein